MTASLGDVFGGLAFFLSIYITKMVAPIWFYQWWYSD